MSFLFSTGVENGYPTIADGGRIDQMERSGHLDRWADDFGLARELGVRALRWGPPYYRVHTGPGRFDWSVADAPLGHIRAVGMEVIADLCHFGVPSWLDGVQDPAFPTQLAAYARAFARRYPWVRHFTPVHEIYACASFSTLRGRWNERETSEAAFVRAVRNLSLAHELAVEAILSERRDAVIVQTESVEHFHAADPRAVLGARRWNARRFLALDLTTGRALAPSTAAYLRTHGVSADDLAFLRGRRAVGQRWLGADHHATCERVIDAHGAESPAPRPFGLARLAGAYHERYGLPLLHCGTDAADADADASVGRLRRQWDEVVALRRGGIPVVGFTWLPLVDRPAADPGGAPAAPRGLFDADRRERAVGRAFRGLVAAHRGRSAWDGGGHDAGLLSA